MLIWAILSKVLRKKLSLETSTLSKKAANKKHPVKALKNLLSKQSGSKKKSSAGHV